MDYRTNILQDEVKLEDEIIYGINGVVFGHINEQIMVFDATALCDRIKPEHADYKSFMRSCVRYIDAIIKESGISPTELFFQNTNGHILIRAELIFIYLFYISDDFVMYFNDLIVDVLTQGVAFSNDYMYDMVGRRVPSSVLKEIIREREDNGKG